MRNDVDNPTPYQPHKFAMNYEHIIHIQHPITCGALATVLLVGVVATSKAATAYFVLAGGCLFNAECC